jgi:phosphoglycerol transferase MdoB-like AlkP superfamily enzyme
MKKFRAYNSIGFAFLGPFYPLAIFFLIGLATFFVFRVFLYLSNFSTVSAVENSLLIFPVGVRMDTVLLSYIVAPLFLLMIFLPSKIVRIFSPFFSSCLALIMAVFVFMELATFPFMAEFDTRPDRLFTEHIVQFKEVSAMVLKGYLIELLSGVALTSICVFFIYFIFQNIFKQYVSFSFLKRISLFIIVVPLLAVGGRSSISHRPANISTAAFSQSHLVNQLGLNSTYSMIYSYYRAKKHEKDPRKVYGRMNEQKMFDTVLASAGISKQPGSDSEKSLFHFQKSNFSRKKPLNLVIILEESLGAEYVGYLGGLPLTPNIDKLSEEGLSFTNLYSTGTRTVRGIEAIICGFLPTPGKSVVKLERSQQNFFTIAGLLTQKGYFTEFIYGGDSKFDNMRAFFLGNGFQKIHDQKMFNNPVLKGTWGVSDEDLFRKANEVFKSHNNKPFFSLILSTSNHDPFEFPDGRIELYEKPKMSMHNAMKYADYAVGRFFEMARKEKYYENTVFLIIADHSTRLRGQDLVPIQKFHIPGIIIGPGVEPKKYEKVCSQIDMPTTLLDLIGISATHPFIGRPLLSMPENVLGRAVMQYGETNAYMAGNRVIVNRPKMEPSQYIYQNESLVPSALDPDLAEKALAHALLPGYIYYNSLYFQVEDKEQNFGRSTVSGKTKH